MRRLRVRFQDSAAENLESIYLFLVLRGANVRTAAGFVGRIRASCRRIGDAPEGGRPRDDLAPGLRTWPFERRALIAYRVERDEVVVERVFYGGQNVEAAYAGRRWRGEDP